METIGIYKFEFSDRQIKNLLNGLRSLLKTLKAESDNNSYNQELAKETSHLITLLIKQKIIKIKYPTLKTFLVIIQAAIQKLKKEAFKQRLAEPKRKIKQKLANDLVEIKSYIWNEEYKQNIEFEKED